MLDHSETIPATQSVENYLPQNWPLVPKSLGTAALEGPVMGPSRVAG